MRLEKTHNRAAWIMFATILPSSMAFIDGSAVNIALPAIQADLGSSGQQLLWFVSAYTLMLASLILLGGTLGDKLGRKRVFMWGILIFTVGSATCAASPSSGFLIVARLVQGSGGALMIPGSLAIISSHFPPDRRGTAIGTWSAATTITTAGGPILGGFLAQAGLWRMVFLINIPLGIAALLALRYRVPEIKGRGDDTRIDFPGAVAITIALAAFAYGFTSAPDRGFNSSIVVASLCLGAVALLLFILIEHRSESPMVPLSIFRSRAFTGTNLLTLFLYGSLTTFTFFLPLTLVQAQGYPESVAGLTLLPFALLLTIMSRWMGGIADRFGPRIPLIAGPLLVGAGFLITSLTGSSGGADSYWKSYFPGIMLFGIGMGATVAPLTTTVMSSVGEDLSGTASGVNNAVSRVAGVLFLAVLGAVAIFHFGSRVMTDTSGLNLTAPQRAALAGEVTNLGNTAVPAGIPASQTARLTAIIGGAFVQTFRLILYICTAFAWLSAALAALFLGKRAAVAGGPK